MIFWPIWQIDHVDANFFERVDRNLKEWRREVIEVLRSLRREMKDGISGISPEISEPLRREVKRLELDAERVMQSALASVAPSVVGPGSPAYAREALEAYLHHCGIAVTGDVSKLVDLLTAGMSESDWSLILGKYFVTDTDFRHLGILYIYCVKKQ